GKQLPPHPTPLVCWGPESRSEEVAERGEKVGEESNRNPHSTCQHRAVLPPKQIRMSNKTQRYSK
ncbi:hypothetical protein DVA81_19075, partial [Acinetobacter baumannii]